MKKNTLGEDQWARREEEVAAQAAELGVMGQDLCDVGVGTDLMKKTGWTGKKLSAAIRDMLVNGEFPEDTAYKMHFLFTSCTYVTAYLRRRGKHLDAGTRADFAELGWARICDALDKAYPEGV